MSIEMKDVVAGYYTAQEILHGISMHAEEKKITSVIGPNGAGKSTILKVVYGFIKPKRGTILFDGKDITGIEPHILPLMGLKYVPQHGSVFPFLTVEENLKMGVWAFRKNREKVRSVMNEVYDRFPILNERKNVMAGNLSGGEKKMLDLGRVLATSPKAILVDEPTAGLAPKVAEEIYQKLSELKDEEITILLVDQNVKKAVMLSDYVNVVKRGQITLQGTKKEFDQKLRMLIKDWLI